MPRLISLHTWILGHVISDKIIDLKGMGAPAISGTGFKLFTTTMFRCLVRAYRGCLVGVLSSVVK